MANALSYNLLRFFHPTAFCGTTMANPGLVDLFTYPDGQKKATLPGRRCNRYKSIRLFSHCIFNSAQYMLQVNRVCK